MKNGTNPAIDIKTLREQTNSHPAQKVIRELIDDPMFHDMISFEIADVARGMEVGQTIEERELWNSYSEETRDLLRKAYFNRIVERKQSIISEYIRVDMIQRRREGLQSLMAGWAEIDRVIKKSMACERN